MMSEVRKASLTFRTAAIANLAKVTPEHRAAAALKTSEKLKGRPRHDKRSLSFEQAEQIRAEKAEGCTYAQLSARYGLSRPTLFLIVKRQTYAAP